MKEGDVLNGYRIETKPTNAGGGMSQWAFGTKDGQDYFVKLFLSPKYPADDGPGSEAAKGRKRAACHAFERRHVEIARRLDPSKPGAGNLVMPCDFFRVDSTYVKVMPRVRAAALPDAHLLSGFQIQVLLRSLAFSLRMLHEEHVVHGDIKPDNVMVEKPNDELYVSKLIDFDEAYVVGEPPLPEHIVGDPIYYSPELLRYIKQDERLPADALGTASDMFSLGLLLHHFLTGRLPAFDRTNVNYPAEALLARQPLDLSALPTVVQPIVARMLALVPDRRPSIQDVIDFLAEVDADSLVPTHAAVADPKPLARLVPTGRPGHAGGGAAGTAARPSDTPVAAGPTLSGTLSPRPGPPAAGATPAAGRPSPAGPTGAGPPAGGGPGPRPVAPRPVGDRPPKPTESGGLRSTMGRRRRSTDDPTTGADT